MKIGLVGKPNVGKSTFFAAATLAPAAIGNYPFTTIQPNHGVDRKLGRSAGRPAAARRGALPPALSPPRGGLRPPRPPEGSRCALAKVFP